MICRTDLAIEATELIDPSMSGITSITEQNNDIKITRTKIENPITANKIGKPVGDYITLEFPKLTDNFKSTDNKISVIANEIKSFLPKSGLILVVGLGNINITPDAFGPKTAKSILATRHIQGEIARSTGLDKLRAVAVLSPGVLGQTGIESAEFIKTLADSIKPSAIIVIDALASQQLSRLGCTIQISNTGISPGSGVMNSRPSISKDTMSVPVVSIGIPTVVDAKTLAADILSLNNKEADEKLDGKISDNANFMMVTPREIDLLIDRASKLTGMSINCALQPDFSAEDLFALTS